MVQGPDDGRSARHLCKFRDPRIGRTKRHKLKIFCSSPFVVRVTGYKLILFGNSKRE